MKKWIALAGIATLAACAQGEAPAADEDAAMEATEDTAQSVVVPGTYEVAWPDGNVTTTTIADDGTFTTVSGEEEQSGTVTDVDGKICFDMPDDDEEADCWMSSEPAEDGSFTSTSEDGTVVTVKPVVDEMAAEG